MLEGITNLMERILLQVPSRMRLIMRKHDAIVLDIALVTPLVDPLGRRTLFRGKPSDIVVEHGQVWASVYDPLSQLLAASPAQHHARRVVAAAVVQPVEPRVFAHQGLVVRREALGAADRRLDACSLEGRDQRDGALHVLAEHGPVQLVQAEVEVGWDLSSNMGR